MTPKGKPTTSTERMRLKRLREKGEAPALPQCKACGKTMKPSVSKQSKAAMDGLCWACWKLTPAGKKERQRQNLAQDVWRVAYFGCKPDDEPPVYCTTMRKALAASYVDRTLTRNGPVWVVWSDSTVTVHHGLSAATALKIQPDDGDVVGMEEDADWFRERVPEDKRTWFNS